MPNGISPRIDLFAILILLGIGQGLFLAYFFLSGGRGKILANRFLGFLLLSLSAIITEIFLGYTNYMFEVIWLIDFSEPFNFTIAPLFYLYIHSKLHPQFSKNYYWHFTPFVCYLIYSFTWQFQNLDFKFNAYICAYHPHVNSLKINSLWISDDPLNIREYVNELFFVSMIIYFSLSIWELQKAFKKEKLSYFSNQKPSLVWVRRIMIQLIFIIALFLIVKLNFKRDLGDHILAAHIALIIYIINFSVVSQSMFFQEEKTIKKYEKSSLSTEIQDNTLKKLQELMQNEKPFLNPDFSLPSLAKKLTISPHHLSQILNEQLKQNFFEFTAQYRIEESCKILQSSDSQHLKIEEIAEMVGYNSKSTFNTSFKKLVGLTPSEFKKNSMS